MMSASASRKEFPQWPGYPDLLMMWLTQHMFPQKTGVQLQQVYTQTLLLGAGLIPPNDWYVVIAHNYWSQGFEPLQGCNAALYKVG